MKGSNCEGIRKLLSSHFYKNRSDRTYFLCTNNGITFYRGYINYNWLANIIVERNVQVRTFVLSVLREGIEAGTNVRNPGLIWDQFLLALKLY